MSSFPRIRPTLLLTTLLAAWCSASVQGQVCTTPVTLPYTQAFNGLAPGEWPACFTDHNATGTPGGGWTTGTLTGSYFSGPSAMVNTTEDGPFDAWLFLPLAHLSTTETYRLSYRFGTNSGSTGANNQGRLSIHYGTTATPAGMVHTIVDHGTFSHAAQSTHTDLSPAVSGNYYIGFRANSAPYTWLTVIDDVVLALRPECLEPSGVTATGPGFTDVQLSWTCVGCTGPYIIEHGPAAGFTTPGTGTTAGTHGTIASTTANSPFLLDGLTMGENYRVFVRQNCPGGVGSNSLPVQFSTVLGNTLCGNAAELVCNDVVSGATHQALPLPDISNYCDQSIFQTRGAWYTVEGNGGIYTVSSAPADGGWTIGSPDLVLFTGNCGDLQCLSHAPWSASLEGSRITWTTEPGAEYHLYVYGDAASFQLATTCEEAPTCFPPSAISVSDIGTNNAQFTWTNSAAPQYGYEVRTSGQPGSGPAGLVTSATGVAITPLNIPGLAPGTDHVLYVRGICAGNDLSAWSAHAFTTLCAATTVPYNGGFIAAEVPACYRVLDVNNDGTWRGVPRPNGNYGDAFIAQYGLASGAPMADDWLITQGVSTVAGTVYRVTYKYSVISAVYPERMTVYYGNGATPTALTQVLADHPHITNNHNNVISASVDITPGAGVLYVGFRATSQSNGWQLNVGDIRIEAAPTCAPPTAVSLSGITQTGATLHWTGAPGAVDHTYEIRTSGAAGSGAVGLVASGTVTGNSATVTGQLTHSTSYQVHVRAGCGANGPSIWTDGITLQTLCPATGIPYSEDFSGMTNGSVPLCSVRETPGQVSPEGWGQWNVSTQLTGVVYDLPVVEVVTVENLNYDSWLFTRGLELTGGVAYRITYRYGTNSGSLGNDNQGRLSVWFGSSPEISAMTQPIVDHGTFGGLVFDALQDFTPPSTGTWHIGFRVNSAPNTRRVVLDDLLVDIAPTCLEPTDVVVLSGSGSTAQVNWACLDCPGEFIVEYGPASVYTAPGTGSAPGPNGTISSSNATSPHFITGLTTGENYRVFVRQVCANDDHGLPSPGITFSTPLVNGFCGQALPLVCGGTALGATSNAPTWPNIQDFCGYDPYETTGVWYRITGNGGVYTVSSCPEDGGNNLGEVDLLVLSGQCNNFTCVALAEAGAGDCGGTRVQWETAPGVQYFIWAIGTGTSFQLTAHCEAPVVCAAPASPVLTGLTPTSAQVEWTVVPGDTYDQEVRTSGAPGSGATGLVTSGNGLVTGILPITSLAPATDHTVYIRRHCTAEELTSAWSSLTFRTACTTTDVPYNGAFTTNSVPDCYRVIDVASNGTWQSHAFTLGGYVDGHVARIGEQPGTAKDDWLITQGLNTTAGASYKLSFRRSVISALYGERLAVYYGTAPVAAAMTELLLDHGTITNSVPQADDIVFTPGAGPIYIGFKAYSLASGWQLYVGDIRVELDANCGAPTALAHVTTPTSVQVDWTCPGCTGEYYVEYGPVGFLPGTGTSAGNGTLVGPLSGNGTVIEGLSGDLQDLRFVVRRDCSGNGTELSANSAPVAALELTHLDCTTRLNVSWCYGNNEDSFHRYIGTAPIALQFTGGSPQSCCDLVHVYDGPGTNAPVLFSGNVLTNVEVGSTNPWHILTVRIISDAGYSCADGSTGALTWDVACGSVGLEEASTSGIAPFPVPTSDLLHYEVPGTAGLLTLEVIDLQGRMLVQQQAVAGPGLRALDVGMLPNGHYILRLLRADQVVFHRFQVMH